MGKKQMVASGSSVMNSRASLYISQAHQVTPASEGKPEAAMFIEKAGYHF